MCDFCFLFICVFLILLVLCFFCVFFLSPSWNSVDFVFLCVTEYIFLWLYDLFVNFWSFKEEVFLNAKNSLV